MKITPARARWFGKLGALVVRCLGATWRVRRRGHDHAFTADYVLAFLHGDMLIPAFLYRRSRAAVLISQHGDGEVIAQVIERLGYATVRGSTTRGGSRAILELLKHCQDRPWGVTPDGPRGPRGRVQEGVIQLAAETGRKVYPVGYAVSRGKRLSSWDRFVIPAPFARIVSHLGEPLEVPAAIDREQRKELAKELELRLQGASAAAATALRQW